MVDEQFFGALLYGFNNILMLFLFLFFEIAHYSATDFKNMSVHIYFTSCECKQSSVMVIWYKCLQYLPFSEVNIRYHVIFYLHICINNI